MINRGSELTHEIECENMDFLKSAQRIRLILAQNGRPVIVYDTDDNDGRLSYNYQEKILEFRMTQEESLKLSTAFDVEIEIRWQILRTNNNKIDTDHIDLPPVPVGKIIDRRIL